MTEDKTREQLRQEYIENKDNLNSSKETYEGLARQVEELSNQLHKLEPKEQLQKKFSLFRKAKSASESYFESSDKQEFYEKKKHLKDLQTQLNEIGSNQKHYGNTVYSLIKQYIEKVNLFPGSKESYEREFDVKLSRVDTGEPDKGTKIMAKKISSWSGMTDWDYSLVDQFYDFLIKNDVCSLVECNFSYSKWESSTGVHASRGEAKIYYGIPVRKVKGDESNGQI
jgi:hypothetical protein